MNITYLFYAKYYFYHVQKYSLKIKYSMIVKLNNKEMNNNEI